MRPAGQPRRVREEEIEIATGGRNGESDDTARADAGRRESGSPLTPAAPTYVLVHGAFSNAAQWIPVQRELGLLGHRTLAVELPGHGFSAGPPLAYQAPQDLEALAAAESPMAGVRLPDNVERVLEIIQRVREHGPVVLVAHSRGGITLTAAGNAAPELIDRMVYISAWCPVDRPVAEYLSLPEFADAAADFSGSLVGDPATIGAIRQNFRTADPDQLDAFQRAFLQDGTREQLLRFLNGFDIDENLDVGGPDDRAQPETWGTVPRSYVRLTDDRAMPLAGQDLLIAEADALTPQNPFEVHSLPGSHLRAFAEGRELARVLAERCGPGPSRASGEADNAA